MLEMGKKRFLAFDIVKGFSMLCIIAGHFSDGLICRFVFTFHVPVFFLIGGYFYKADITRIKPRIMRLLKPYLFTVAAITCLDIIKHLLSDMGNHLPPSLQTIFSIIKRWLLAGLYGSGSRRDFFSLRPPVIGAIWFLLTFIWVMLFLEAMEQSGKHFLKKKPNWNKIIFTCGLFLFGYGTARFFWLPLSLQAACVSFLFFVIGYSVKRQLPSLLHHKPIIIVSAIIWLFAILVSIRHDYMSLVRCAFPDLPLNIVGACGASTTLLSLANYLSEQKRLSKVTAFLAWIGQNTIPFLCFHLIELNVFPWRIISRIGPDNPLVTILIFCLKTSWCLLGVAAGKRVALLKKVFL